MISKKTNVRERVPFRDLPLRTDRRFRGRVLALVIAAYVFMVGSLLFLCVFRAGEPVLGYIIVALIVSRWLDLAVVQSHGGFRK